MIENLVTTVIPVFNRPAMLQEAVDSVLAQTWRPIEIVIVDDGSTDCTLQTARALAARHPGTIRVVAQANGGPGAARQAGVEAANGEFVQFLDSDDRLLPEKFAVQVGALRSNPEAGIAYGKTWTVSGGVRSAQPAQRTGEVHWQVFPALLAGRLWETSTPLYRRDALTRIGPWPRKRQMEDWEFDAQAGSAGIMLAHCDEFVSEYVIHDGPRLAHAWQQDEAAMRDRARAYLDILRHAQAAGVSMDTPEMRGYARTLFWMAREAGARGLVTEAEELLAKAEELSTRQARERRQIRAYRLLGRVVGFPAAASLASLLLRGRHG